MLDNSSLASSAQIPLDPEPADDPRPLHGSQTSRRLILFSCFTPIWGSGLLLAACFFLPLCLLPGCTDDTGTTHYFPYSPSEKYDNLSNETDGLATTFFLFQQFDWPYGFGALAAFGTLLVLATRNLRNFRVIWFLYAAYAIVIIGGIWLSMGDAIRESRKTEGPNAGIDIRWAISVLVPSTIVLITLVASYLNCRTWFSAAMWVQLTLAALSIVWFAVLRFLFGFEFLVGGTLSLAASVVLAIATVCTWRRGPPTFAPSEVIGHMNHERKRTRNSRHLGRHVRAIGRMIAIVAREPRSAGSLSRCKDRLGNLPHT